MAVSQNRVKDHTKQGFQKHMIRLSMADHVKMMNVGDSRIEMSLTNSHDRSSAFQLHAGLFRLVCSNGLVICDSDMGRVSTKHIGGRADDVIEASYQILDNVKMIGDKVDLFQSVNLSYDEQMALASAAAVTKYGEASPVSAGRLLAPRRAEEAQSPGERAMGSFGHGLIPKGDLWTTFNVLQENLTKGGQTHYSQNRRRLKTRPVEAIDANTKINKALWMLAVEMAKLKGAA